MLMIYSQEEHEGCIQQTSVLSIFGKDSFHGNLGLRGFPLQKPCRILDPTLAEGDGNQKKSDVVTTLKRFTIGLAIGVFCSVVVASVLMHLVLVTGRPKFFVELIIKQDVDL